MGPIATQKECSDTTHALPTSPMAPSNPESSKAVLGQTDDDVDHYWGLGLVVFLASFMTTAVVANAAFFYVHLKDAYATDYGAASWPLTALAISTRLSGLTVHLLLRHIPVYAVALFGSVMAWLGILLSGFAPSIVWVTATLGVLHGSGVGVVLLSFSVCSLTHFRKYRGTISGIKYVGWSAAGIVGPPAMSLLAVNFGLKRTFILLGLLLMNVSPLALFLKAPDVLCCSCHKAAHLTPTSRLLKGKPYPKYVEENSKKNRTACIKNSSASQPQEERNDRNSHMYTKKVASISESVGKDLSVTKTTDENRAIKLTGASTISELPHLNVPSKRQGAVSHAVSVRQGLGKAMKTAVFYVIVAVYVIFDYTSVAVRATFVAFAMDKGLPRHEAESLIMYDAFGGLVGRLVLPWLSDILRLRRSVATAACLAALSACLALLTGATSHVAVALVVVASSLPTGFIASMKPVMMADYIGLENLGATWSLAGAFTVPLLLANPAIIGYFRDRMASFDNLYFLCSALNLFAGIVLLIQSRFEKNNSK